MIDSVSAARATPLPVGASTTIAATWVIVKTKTRSKNSSSVDTRIGGSADVAVVVTATSWRLRGSVGDRETPTTVLGGLDLVEQRHRVVGERDVLAGRLVQAERVLAGALARSDLRCGGQVGPVQVGAGVLAQEVERHRGGGRLALVDRRELGGVEQSDARCGEEAAGPANDEQAGRADAVGQAANHVDEPVRVAGRVARRAER